MKATSTADLRRELRFLDQFIAALEDDAHQLRLKLQTIETAADRQRKKRAEIDQTLTSRMSGRGATDGELERV